MADIVLYLQGDFVVSPEKVFVGIDDTVLAETQTVTGEISISTELSPGPHVLWVELANMIPENQIHDQGRVVRQTFVEIENIKIDNCMMNILTNDCGHSTIDWEYHPDVAEWFRVNRGEVPKILDKSKLLCLKGMYKFQFEYPIQDWLKQQITLHTDYLSMYNQPLDQYRALQHLLDSLN